MSNKDSADRDDLMERTRAAVAFCNTTDDPGTDMAAFMALFHPDAPQELVMKMAQASRRR